MSFGVESFMPMHSATASALMNSLIAVSRPGYGWMTEGSFLIGNLFLLIFFCNAEFSSYCFVNSKLYGYVYES